MKVTCFDNVNRFRDFYIKKEANSHDYCTFSFVSSEIESYYSLIDDEVKITEDDRYLMCGKISSIETIRGNTENIITVTVHSLSSEHDKTHQTRIYHKINQKYSEIIKETGNIISIDINISKSCNDEETNNPVIQNETDFQFLKKLSQDAYSSYLFFDSVNKRYIVGSTDGENKQVSLNETTSMKIQKSDKSTIISFYISGTDTGQELRQYVDLGKTISFSNKNYLIIGLTIEKTDCVYRYHVVAESKIADDEENAVNHSPVIFRAKVTDVNDPDNYGRVRLDFSQDDIEDKTPDNKMWHSVLTPYTADNGGFVFIPDVDDMVEVLWDGQYLSVAGCIRQKSLAERYQDVTMKQIGNLYERNINFTKDKLEISAKETMIVLKDDSILMTVPDTKVYCDKDTLKIEVKKTQLEINDDFKMKSSNIHIDSDSVENNVKKDYICESKSIEMKAKSEVTIQGNKKVSIN